MRGSKTDLFSKIFSPALGLTQHPIQWVPGFLQWR